MSILSKARRAAEKAFAPGSVLSYSQSGEDLVLDFLTGYAPTGFYVDVGCNHPIRLSNSYRFYRKGWAGICIDANPKFARAFRSQRPRDQFIQACVSDREEQVTFHIFASDTLSSISGNRLYDNGDHYALDEVQALTTQPLGSILDAAGAPTDFEFLSIDVEGHDEPALRSIDLVRYRPRVILIELHGADVGHIDKMPVAQHLASCGYTPIAAHWTNLFFMRQD